MTTRFKFTQFLLAALFCSAFLWGQEKTNKATVEDLQEQVSELQDDVEKIKTSLNTLRLGTHKILFSGNIRTQFIADEGDPSTFDVLMRFHPYWLVGDRFLAKVDTQFTYKNNKTDVSLFFGEIGYILFPWLTAKAGVMLAPFGFFQENVHVEWVQKMADEPLPVTDDLIAPTQILGFQLRGSIPIVSDFRINYALWLANGPRLNDGTNVTNQVLTSHHGSVVPNHPGSLMFNNNYLDNNDNKTVGGRIAFLPWAPVEFGYSAMYGQVGDKGTRFEKVGAFIHGVDVSFMGVIQPLKSRLEIRGEWVQSIVDPVDYGSGLFQNIRSGYYIQVAFRPLLLKNFLGNLELVGRFDTLDVSEDFTDIHDTKRWAVCLNIWLWATIVVKSQIEWEFVGASTTPYRNIRVQLAGGF